MKIILISIVYVTHILNAQTIDCSYYSESKNDFFIGTHISQSTKNESVLDLNLDSNLGRKSIAMAVIYSLLLPGMGELYAGDYSTGKYFSIAEAGLWITFGAYQWYATGLQDDARRYAIQHAQINLANKDDSYFVDIGEFVDIYSFNEQVLRKREPNRIYNPATSYWNWDTDANRETYRLLRVSSEERFNDMKFVVAAIAINHIISAVNAARLAISHNKSLAQTSELNIYANIMGDFVRPTGVMITVSKSF